MKRLIGVIVILSVVAIASATALAPKATNTLTTIDSVPTRQQIDEAFSDSSQTPLQNLASLATDPQNATDVGIRLRAIHALAKYCASTPCVDSDVAHQSLKTVIQDNAHEITGSKVLLLRAGIETLGAMRLSSDSDFLVVQMSLLDHPSRDIRAATARALSDICNGASAITPLRVRYSHELTEQVKLAISEALRILGQCSSNP
ncbi:MAG TPA: hypothetical protein VL326_05695 [Kofleriaceae bacterium]|jgi:hypothetical protein|nr:hypothetical protein [Kofleriaceae bacterium]